MSDRSVTGPGHGHVGQLSSESVSTPQTSQTQAAGSAAPPSVLQGGVLDPLARENPAPVSLTSVPIPPAPRVAVTKESAEAASVALAKADEDGPPSRTTGSKLKDAALTFLSKTKDLFTTKEGLKKLLAIGLGVASLVSAVATGGAFPIAVAAIALAISLARYYAVDDWVKQQSETTQKVLGAVFIVLTLAASTATGFITADALAAGADRTKEIGVSAARGVYALYKIVKDGREFVQEKPAEQAQAAGQAEAVASGRAALQRDALGEIMSARQALREHPERFLASSHLMP